MTRTELPQAEIPWTDQAPGTSISPSTRRIIDAAKAPIAIGLLVITVAVVAALLEGSRESGALDPRSAHPNGSLALTRLLQREGVRVDLVRTLTEAQRAAGREGTTLLVTKPDLVAGPVLGKLLRRADESILISPQPAALSAVPGDVELAGLSFVDTRLPACALDIATKAGAATLGGDEYAIASDVRSVSQGTRSLARAQFCYPGAAGASLVRVSASGHAFTLLGTSAPLTNEKLDEEGNAALAMRLLGKHARLVWYVPSLDDPALAREQRPLLELLPDPWKFALVQVAVAVVFFALWRMRRLGPVVTEPIPVVVRAAETTEGRARLYRAAHAADHAAEALRGAARDRIGRRIGLPVGAEPTALVEAVAVRSDRPPAEVHALLYGTATLDDHALVRLADALDTLENEVRTE